MCVCVCVLIEAPSVRCLINVKNLEGVYLCLHFAPLSGEITPEMDLLYADNISGDLFHLSSLISLSLFTTSLSHSLFHCCPAH